MAVDGSQVTEGIPTSDGRSTNHGTDTVEDIGRRAETQVKSECGGWKQARTRGSRG